MTAPDVSVTPVVALRFTVPNPPKMLVERTLLYACLDHGAEQPLTLVSAPAGSGKTALVAAWAAQRQPQRAVAWVTFEPGDDRPGTLWPLVVECLRRHGVSVPHDSASSHSNRRRMLTELGAALARLAEPLTLVLDGYELVDLSLSKDIEFVLAHSGRRLRLVILTRVDPVLPLHRFRLDGTIAELRMADLAFSPEETAQLVKQCGVTLSDRSVTALDRRTRGWAAGLRFAAMVLTRSEDPDAAIDRLAGDTGNIAEYLMAEMLQTQTPEVRDLLLRTSVVDVLEPGLIEELAGRSAVRMLAVLARGNLLLDELPGQPGWYRYHPFLRDLLRAELAYASPARLRRLRRRAGSWYAQRGAVDRAVALAAESGAWADAARYAIEGLAVGRLVAGDDAGGLATTLRRTPASTNGPSAALVRAAVALADNDAQRCAQELSSVRDSRASTTPADPAVQLAADVIDVVRACYVADAGALALANEAGSSLAAHPLRDSPAVPELSALIQSSKGVAQLHCGEIAEARRTLSAAAHDAEASTCRPLPIWPLAHLAIAASLQGGLHQAGDFASRSVALAEEARLAPENRPPAAEIALAWVSTERYDLRAGSEHVKASLRSKSLDPIARGLRAVVQARLLRAVGDVAGALTLIEAVAGEVPGHATWLANLLGFEAAESRIALGDPELAIHIVRGLERPDPASAILVLGRAHLARGDWAGLGDAVTKLVRADRGIPVPAAVGGHLLEAALELHAGHQRRAIAALGQSLRRAAPEGLRRPFRGAPSAVRHLLDTAPELTTQNPWLDVPSTPRREKAKPPARLGAGRYVLTGNEVIEPLTAKEQEVLGHLSELLTTAEIAEAMFVSVNTVRTHVRSILRKLAVSRRNEAVRRARALSLIDT